MSRFATSPVYDVTYFNYLKQLKSMRFSDKADQLGIRVEADAVVIPYFDRSIRYTPDGLTDETGKRPDFADCVVICRYLIMAPPFEPRQMQWTAYRDFPDAGPLTVFWADTVERPLAKTFSGRMGALEKACRSLGAGAPELAISGDLCRQFTPLPKVSLLLVFNDADDDFPAALSLLFQKRAAAYLDAESQAVLGHVLTQRLLTAATD